MFKDDKWKNTDTYILGVRKAHAKIMIICQGDCCNRDRQTDRHADEIRNARPQTLNSLRSVN